MGFGEEDPVLWLFVCGRKKLSFKSYTRVIGFKLVDCVSVLITITSSSFLSATTVSFSLIQFNDFFILLRLLIIITSYC